MTPIVIFFFKRKHVLKTIQQIREYQPKKLYLVADGGRNIQEHKECMKIRNDVEKLLDWKCDFIKIYKDENLGVDIIMPQTISTIFENEEKLIVLEDDCVADLSFFNFCETMLERYEDNNQIMSISGTNWFDEQDFSTQSYFFSINPESCGWGTWKRAWDLYDNNMANFEKIDLIEIIRKTIKSKSISKQYYNLFKRHYEAAKNQDWHHSHWDGKWLFTFFTNKGLTIVPKKNLITNIGFDNEATHTNNPASFMAHKKRYSIDFPLEHPDKLVCSYDYDLLYTRKILNFNAYSSFKQVIKKILYQIGIST